MATKTHLEGWNVGARKSAMAVAGEDGDPQMEEFWQIMFAEITTGNKILFTMNRETRDELVRQLTGGVVLAGGDFPKI